MRMLWGVVLVVVLLISGCSLIATTMPDPGPWRDRPDRPHCSESYAAPIGDTIFAMGGSFLALGGVGAMIPDPPGATTRTSQPAVGAVLLGGGILFAAFETTVASMGYRRVKTCSEASTEWALGSFDRLAARRREMAEAAGRFLNCPQANLALQDLSFEPTDPLREQWQWSTVEATGCSLAAWCGRRGGTINCTYPADFFDVTAQLAVETQCRDAVPQMRQVFEQRRWLADRGEAAMQISWRIEGCGHAYACMVTGGLAANIYCKAALADEPSR